MVNVEKMYFKQLINIILTFILFLYTTDTYDFICGTWVLAQAYGFSFSVSSVDIHQSLKHFQLVPSIFRNR